MKKALVIFGTRPEAIKMAPLVHAGRHSTELEVVTCATAQHRDMLDQVNEFFGVEPDFDLNLMMPNQDLFDVTVNCLSRMKVVLEKVKPDVVLVQGDTTTTYTSALAAFYKKIPVGHIEAGLRTGQKYAPFPEEINRQMVTPIADFHFAPTEAALDNLLAENVPRDRIWVTGNTSIDALLWGSSRNISHPHLKALCGEKPMVLMTAHRRENFGEPFENIFAAVREFFVNNPGMHLIYPVHPNPNVRGSAHERLGDLKNVSLIDPVSYSELIYLMRQCRFLLTDSGGIQEEAPTLGKPVLVLRETTERPEAVDAGCALLVGHDRQMILERMSALSQGEGRLYESMARAANPFGDGTAATQILSVVERHLNPRSAITASAAVGLAAVH